MPQAKSRRKAIGRTNAAKFIERLCKYPGDPKVIAEAQRHILEAHADRLTEETGKTVTVDDIQAGYAAAPESAWTCSRAAGQCLSKHSGWVARLTPTI